MSGSLRVPAPPDRYGDHMFTRMRHGWELTKKSWSVIRSHPRLVRLPITGGVIAFVVAIVAAAPGLWLVTTTSTAARATGVVLLVAAAYLASFFVIYYNVALAAAADQALRGHDPDLGVARAVARSRIGAIAAWAAVSVLVSAALSIIRDKGGVLGNIGASLGAAIWSLVTFLVVPVVTFEEIGPISAIKRSTALFRQKWGEQVTGNVVIGGIASVIMVVGAVIAVLGGAIVSTGSATGAIGGGAIVAIGLAIAIAGAVFGGATKGVFGVALYRYVADDETVGPFTAPDLEGAARRA